jgi:para-aminobenzoate synthetase component I
LNYLDKSNAQNIMNKLGQDNCPFLFVVDYEQKQHLVLPLDDLDNGKVKVSIHDKYIDFQNFESRKIDSLPEIVNSPISFSEYNKAFEKIKSNINFGNSFLANLTVETPISTNLDFNKLIEVAHAKYKLSLFDDFVCFSPESFVSVDKEGKISSFPMKGTIDASVKHSKEILENDAKEKYEHTTIVDLIRNDLSEICEKVWVERFRFIEKIKKSDGGSLFQMSSEVCGQLPKNWKSSIGDWLFKLLPAGSITGAPKNKTIEIIKEAETLTYNNLGRGFYSGIFGIFDGNNLSSGVMIRFIEKKGSQLVYKSGGGITSRSEAQKEYQELISKIYVPVF